MSEEKISRGSICNYPNLRCKRSESEFGILKGPELPYLTGYNSYGEFILEELRSDPNFIGEMDGVTGREVKFSEMMEKSVKCAMWMRKEGLRTGDVVGICTHNQMDMYVPCLASLYLGVIYNPWWNSGITKDLTRYFLDHSKPKLVFADEASVTLIGNVITELNLEIKIIVFGEATGFRSLDDVIGSEEDPASEFQCAKLSSIDEPAVILYTSGTTGYPKGSLHSNRSLFGNCRAYSRMGKIEGTVRSLTFSQLAWCTGMTIMLRAIQQRETRIIYPEFQEEKMLELVNKYKVNWILMGMSAAKRLQLYVSLLSTKLDLPSLKYIWITGAIMSKATLEDMTKNFPGIKVYQCYGLTEIGLVAMQNETTKRNSCGRLIFNAEMKVIDRKTGKLLGPNEPGEGLVKSPTVMIGYLNNPSATRNAVDANGWLHTGDIVYYDESGQIYVTDRIKELIKCRDNHISPSMIEDTLLRHPDVLEVVVVGKSHEIDGAHPTAFVLKKPNAEVTRAELEELVADALPDYMKLRGGVTFVDKMLHTASGKIDRNAFRKLLSR